MILFSGVKMLFAQSEEYRQRIVTDTVYIEEKHFYSTVVVSCL